MVCSIVIVFEGGATELGEGDDDEIVPAALVGVLEEVFAEGIDGPADPAEKIRMIPIERALGGMGVPTIDLGSGDEGIGPVEDEGCGAELSEEVVGVGGNDVFGGVVAAGGIAAVGVVGGGEQVVGQVAVGCLVVEELLVEVDGGEGIEGATDVGVLEVEEFAGFAVGSTDATGFGEELVGLEVAGCGVGDAEQVVAVGVADVGHGGLGAAEEEGQGGLEGNAGEGVGGGEAGFDHGPVEDAVLDEVIAGAAGLPIVLGIEMGTGLIGVTDAMDEGEVAGVVDGGEELEGGMEGGELVAECEGAERGAVGPEIGAGVGAGDGEMGGAA